MFWFFSVTTLAITLYCLFVNCSRTVSLYKASTLMVFSLCKKSNPQSLLILLAYKIEEIFFAPAEYRYCLFSSTLRSCCSESLQKIDLFPFAQQPWSWFPNLSMWPWASRTLYTLVCFWNFCAGYIYPQALGWSPDTVGPRFSTHG